ncbi:MAG: proton-conducting transporter membrane subunit [bacterium]
MVFPRKWLKTYAPLALFAVAVYHLFIPRAGSLDFRFMGFTIQLFQYRWPAQLIGLVVSFFGFAYFIYEWANNHSRYFYIFAFIHVASALSLLFVNDFLSFFIFWECLTLSAVALIFIDSSSSKLIRKYFIYQLAGTVMLLTGVAINYTLLGDMSLTPVTGAYFFFLPAVFIKAAVIPFHSWLPSTYPRVSPGLTVFLSAYVTKIGVFSLFLLVPLLVLEVAGGILALGAVLMALGQNKLRYFLSYHLISQIGYMLAGISGASLLATVGGFFHLVNHVLYKGLLFMIVGVLIGELNDEKIEGKGGLAVTRRHPLLFVVALIASAAITGLPPFNGYVSKTVIAAGLESNVAVFLLKVTSFGTGLSFVKFIYNCFLKSSGNKKNVKKSAFGPGRKISVFLLGSACLVMGIVPRFFLINTPAAEMSFYYPQAISKGLLPGLVAVFIFIVFWGEINIFVKYLTVDRFEGSYLLRSTGKFSLNKLRLFHSGNVQHYLFWLFLMLGTVWLFLYCRVNQFIFFIGAK